MFFNLATASASVLYLGQAALAGAAILKTRSTSAAFSLLAYGTDIDGLPVIYGDSYAYVGYNAPSSVSVASNVTFTLNDTSLIATQNTSAGGSSDFTGSHLLYIDTATYATSQAGFISSDDSTNLTDTDFVFYGKQLAWEDTTTETVYSNFWATTTDEDGTWKLIWDQSGVVMNNSVPVVVKRVFSS